MVAETPTTEADWELAEPHIGPAFRDVVRLGRRGWRRKGIALAIPLLASLHFTNGAYTRAQAHVAMVVLTLPPEAAFGRKVQDFLRRTMSPGQVARVQYSDAVLYVNSVVFSDERLLEIMRSHPEFDELLRKGPQKALDAMRDTAIASQYAGGYVGEHTEEIEDLLGQRLKISCTAETYSKLMLRVCLELAALVLTYDTREHMDKLATDIGADDFLLVNLRHDLELANQQIIEKSMELAALRADADDDAPRNEREARLYLDIAELNAHLRERANIVAGLAIRNRMRRNEPLVNYLYAAEGIASAKFNILTVDAGRTGPPDPVALTIVCLLAAIIPFTLLLPFALLLVGVLDRRVYEQEDIADVGLDPLGVVELGSMKRRSRLPWRRRHG